MHLDDILFGSFRVINGTSHFGGVICLVHLSFLKMCAHEYYHLVLILQDYLVTMWCVILMRNSNSKCPLIIFSWTLFASCWKEMNITLWGSYMLVAYHKPKKCEHMRYCHLELILLIILFLGGMLAQTRSYFIKSFYCSSYWSLFEWEILGAAFPQIHISISYLGDRLLHVIPIIALHDCVTSWSYQESQCIVLIIHILSYAFYCEVDL